MGAIEEHHIYGLQLRESANDGSDFSNPDADYRIGFLGEDGVWHFKDSSGTVTAPGGGSSLTVEEVDGSPTDAAVTKIVFPNGSLAIASHVATYTPPGGGGLAHSFVGYNTVGGSQESLTNQRQLMKQITLASAATLVSIDAHLQATTTDPSSVQVMVLDDAAGLPTLIRASAASGSLGFKGGNAARWFSVPIGCYLPAGTYWIGFLLAILGSSGMKLSYDTSGSDRYVTVGPFSLDGDYTTTTDSTRKYSIRANILS